MRPNIWSIPGTNTFTMKLPVLASKLRSPEQLETHIRRPQIERSICGAPAAKLILVHGPAGVGKTTTMLQYYEQLRSRDIVATWLRLDDDDNDFERFLAGQGAIFAQIAAAAGVDTLSKIHEPAELIQGIAELDRPLALFIDDCENIRNPAVLDFMRRMIQHLPAGGRLVIGSRSIPELGLGRLRVSHQLLEIGPAQLRFSLDETMELLGSRQHRLSYDEMRLLHRHTEGFAAALHLATLSLSSAGDHRRLIANFSGSNASVSDYLEEEVFARLPNEIQDFLLNTCLFSEICAPLCDAVTSNPRSGELLAQLERANLFLTPLDADRCWYRYHSLFAEFLRTRLKRDHPERVAGLHRAASRWYAGQGRPVPAIEHALAGEDADHVTVLLEQHAEVFLRQHRPYLLVRWYGALSPSLFETRPRLRLVFAWALALARRDGEAIALIESLDRSDNRPLSDDGIRLACVAIRVTSLIMADKLSACSEACRDGPSPLPEEASFAGGMLALFSALCLIAADKFDEATLMIAETRRQYAALSASGLDFARVQIDGVQSTLALIQGRLHDPRTAQLRIAVADWGADSSRELGPVAHLGVYLAKLRYLGDELPEAERLLTEYLPRLVTENSIPDLLIMGYVVRARIADAQNDRAGALQMLSDLEHVGHQQGLPRLVANHWLERSRIALLEGEMGAAETFWKCASDAEAWSPLGSLVPFANDVDTLEVGRIRILNRTRRCEEAVPEIRRQLREAELRGRRHRALKLKILLAEALHGCGNTRSGLRMLHEAVQFASREGFVRTFAEEGSAVAQMLGVLRRATYSDVDVAERMTAPAEFLDRVLQACGCSTAPALTPVAAPPALSGGVTRGEQRVLELVAQGLSNAAIAKKLFVAPTTVNAHLRSINSKLGVHNRTQAVAVARNQGLIAMQPTLIDTSGPRAKAGDSRQPSAVRMEPRSPIARAV